MITVNAGIRTINFSHLPHYITTHKSFNINYGRTYLLPIKSLYSPPTLYYLLLTHYVYDSSLFPQNSCYNIFRGFQLILCFKVYIAIIVLFYELKFHKFHHANKYKMKNAYNRTSPLCTIVVHFLFVKGL